MRVPGVCALVLGDRKQRHANLYRVAEESCGAGSLMDPVAQKRKPRPVAVGGEAGRVLSTPLSFAFRFCIRGFVAGLRGSDSALTSSQLGFA